MSYFESQTEARKCIGIHSHLSTCLYNWAVAHTLYRQQVVCWSTTVAYYAMIHSTRTLFSLIELDQRLEYPFKPSQTKRERLREIMKFHTYFCYFLKDQKLNKDDRTLRELCIECFKQYFPHTDWSAFLMDVGGLLELHKKARETETYEHFVVAHHGRGYHFVAQFIETIFMKSEEDANKRIPEILNYVLKHYQNQIPMRAYHLWHLKDELKWLERTLDKEKLLISKEMKAFVNSVKSLVKGVKMPADYLDFEKEMDMNYYTYKGEVYGSLKDLARELTGDLPVR